MEHLEQVSHGDTFEISSFIQNKSGTNDGSLKPYSVKRKADGEIFTIGDSFILASKEGTYNNVMGIITGFELLESDIFINHTWSGIGFSLDSISHGMPILPSNLQVNEVAKVKFKENCEFTATIRGVHFFKSKVKYDLGLWLGDGSTNNPEIETRIYNVDSVFVSKF